MQAMLAQRPDLKPAAIRPKCFQGVARHYNITQANLQATAAEPAPGMAEQYAVLHHLSMHVLTT